MANMTCPICKGSGKNIEDSNEYEFITRDPITKRCLFCDGSGKIAPMKVLPNGLRACDMKPDRKKLNVSLKDKIIADLTPGKQVDTGLGYVPESKEDALPTTIEALTPTLSQDGRGSQDGRTQSAPTEDTLDGFISPKEPCELPRFAEMALNPRLNKVLASGKEFLIVTETEPYYLDVYRLIRIQERAQGTWTVQDEERYVDTLEEHIEVLQKTIRYMGALTPDPSPRTGEGRNNAEHRHAPATKEVVNG